MFENHRKSLIQHCERSELRLHFEWTKINLKDHMRHLGDFSTTVFLHCFASYLQSWIQEVVRGKTCTSASFFKLTHFHRWIYVRNVGYIAWKKASLEIKRPEIMHFRHNH